MDIEHFDCLSWFLDKRESHEQDGETLPFATTSRIQAASSAPAIAIGPSGDAYGQCPVALNRQLCSRTNGGCTLKSSSETRGISPRAILNGGYPAVQSVP